MANFEAVRTQAADKIGLVLQGKGGIVHRRGIHFRLAQGETQLRQMGHFIYLAAGRLEEDRRADAAMDVSQGAFSIGV